MIFTTHLEKNMNVHFKNCVGKLFFADSKKLQTEISPLINMKADQPILIAKSSCIKTCMTLLLTSLTIDYYIWFRKQKRCTRGKCVNRRTYTHTHIFMNSFYVFIYVCVFVSVFKSLSTHKYSEKHTYDHIYICKWMTAYIYIYIYI